MRMRGSVIGPLRGNALTGCRPAHATFAAWSPEYSIQPLRIVVTIWSLCGS